jgi:transposase
VPNHKDLNKLNNLPSNLEWVTSKANSSHAVKSLQAQQSDYFAQHSDALVKEVLELVIKGTPYNEISELTGVRSGTISLWAKGFSRHQGELTEKALQARRSKFSDKLSTAQIEAICTGIIKGRDVASIAQEQNVKPGTITALLRGSNRQNDEAGLLITARKHWAEKTDKKASKGSANHFSKLNESVVAQIKLRLQHGESCAEIAKRYGVQGAAISKINRGRTWRHVEPAQTLK